MKFKLQTSFSLTICSLIIITVSILSVILLHQFRNSHNRLVGHSSDEMSANLLLQMEKQGETITRLLAENLINPLNMNDMQAIHDLLNTTKSRDDILRVIAYDVRGKVIHDGTEAVHLFGTPIRDNASKMAIREKDKLIKHIREERLVVSLPVWIGDTPLGGVQVTLSLKKIQGEIARITDRLEALHREGLVRNIKAVVFTTILLLAVGILLSLFAARRMIRPIHHLKQLAAMIGRGKYDVEVSDERKDEVGDLLNSFRQMGKDLQQTTVSKKYVDGIINNMTDAVTVISPAGLIESVNQSTCSLLGYRENELVGRSFSVLFPDSPDHSPDGILNRLESEQAAAGMDTYFKTIQGALVPVLCSASKMANTEGGIEGFLCVAQDNTERQRAEEKLKVAKESAEAVRLEKSQFLASVSHGIRTPMNGVLGMAELLLHTELTEKQRKLAFTVQNSGKLLLNTVNDIIDFFKMESGKFEIERIDFDIRSTVEETVGLVAQGAFAKGLELTLFIDNDISTGLIGDPTRIQQVFVNLLGNAIKFTDKGEVAIRISAPNNIGNRTRLCFEIRDTGIGIRPDLRDTIFDAFFQTTSPNGGRFGRVGLGLAISKFLVELMDGEIGLHSHPEGGSTFWFELEFEKQPRIETADNKISLDLGGTRLLIAEPNDRAAGNLAYYLESLCPGTDHTKSGKDTLIHLKQAWSENRSYDFMFVSSVLEDMHGLDLVQQIRNDHGLDSLKVILMTPVNTPDIQNSRISGYIAKPVQRDLLFNCLVSINSSSPSEEPERKQAPVETVDNFGAHILLAEDNHVNQEVVKYMLKNLGCEVDIVANGEEAVEAAFRTDYDLILMDCEMPELDGFDATQQIRAQEFAMSSKDHTGVTIIALTALAMPGDRKRCIEVGMDDYVSKPFSIDELRRVMSKWLNGSETGTITNLDPVYADGRAHGCPLDQSVIKNIKDLQQKGMPDIFQELVEIYLTESDCLLNTLFHAIEENDAAKIERTAHSLKSTSGNMGALELSELCKKIELNARQRMTNHARDSYSKVFEEYQRVQSALKEQLKIDNDGFEFCT